MAKTEEQIRISLAEQLRWDDRLEGCNIQFQVRLGRVTLTGTAATEEARTAAEANAWRTAGVSCVDNEIVVLAAVGSNSGRACTLRTSLERRFACDAKLASCGLVVESAGRDVVLRGTVDALWKKRLAEDIARRSLGQWRVLNQIGIVPGHTIEDTHVAENIARALRQLDPEGTLNLDVIVESGVVTISGNVPSWQLFSQADSIAQRIPGVQELRNQLRIRPADSLSQGEDEPAQASVEQP